MKTWIILFIMALVLSGDTKELYLSLDKGVRREIDEQMRSLALQVDHSIENLANDIANFAEGRPNLGEKQILNQLQTLQKESGGIFSDAAVAMTGAVTDKVFTIDTDVFFDGLKTEADFNQFDDTLMWQAMLVNTCPSCLGLHGQIRKRATWNVLGGPNERATLCTIRGKCHCILVPAESLPSTAEMRKPIRIQAARIRKAEKKRGKKYAKSTRTSFLGRINDPTSKVFDLRKVKKVKA